MSTERTMTDAELIALAALAVVDAHDCQAANLDRASRGEAMAYDAVDSKAETILRKELARRGIL
jgi:hypothetical protein